MSLLSSCRKLPPLVARAFSTQRVSMLLGGDHAQVKCVCVVDSIPAEFQLDSGSTFTQISPELAPQRVPRHGLGSASSLGRRLWFPTCEVSLAPVDRNGHVIDVESAGSQTSLVQVGPSNLLGLNELRRWQVQMDFAPQTQSCSVTKMGNANFAKETARSDSSIDTIPLGDALQAAAILSEGTIAPEEALCRDRPWLVDAGMVLLAHQRHTQEARAPTSWMSMAFPQLQDSLITSRPPKHKLGIASKLKDFGLSSTLTVGVLFGTADALVSHTEIPPLLPPPPWLT